MARLGRFGREAQPIEHHVGRQAIQVEPGQRFVEGVVIDLDHAGDQDVAVLQRFDLGRQPLGLRHHHFFFVLSCSFSISPKDTDSWVAALAQTLTQIHETVLDGAAGALTSPPPVGTWHPPAGEDHPLIAAAVSAVTARLPSLSSERVLAHGDFHPGNVLWLRGRISGVVDWSAARLDARWSELAYCRADVCLLLGPDVADRLADAYSEIVSATSDDLAVYDVMWLFNIRHYAQVALDAYQQQGYAPNLELSLAHLDEQLRRVLSRLDR